MEYHVCQWTSMTKTIIQINCVLSARRAIFSSHESEEIYYVILYNLWYPRCVHKGNRYNNDNPSTLRLLEQQLADSWGALWGIKWQEQPALKSKISPNMSRCLTVKGSGSLSNDCAMSRISQCLVAHSLVLCSVRIQKRSFSPKVSWLHILTWT